MASKRALLAELRRLEADAHALRVIPDGADTSPLPMPDTIEYTEEDLRRMAATWDRLVPDAAGLLQSPVTGKRSNAA